MIATARASDPATWTDAHLHVWDTAVLAPPWLAQAPQFAGKFDLARYFDEGGVRGGLVFVEADVAPADRAREARLFATWGQANGLAWATVAGIDPAADDVIHALDGIGAVRSAGGVTGARRVLHAGDVPFTTERFRVGLHRLAAHRIAFDCCVRWTDLAALEGVIASLGDGVFVLDHLGNPPIKAGWSSPERAEWQRLVARIAACERVSVKWSAMFENAGRAMAADEIRPWFEWCLASFGPARMMWGSNWPVCFAPNSGVRLTQWIEACARLAGELGTDEQAAILGGNAWRIYRPD
ncbi:MAG: amidohydrolase family protein [bacterium]